MGEFMDEIDEEKDMTDSEKREDYFKEIAHILQIQEQFNESEVLENE